MSTLATKLIRSIEGKLEANWQILSHVVFGAFMGRAGRAPHPPQCRRADRRRKCRKTSSRGCASAAAAFWGSRQAISRHLRACPCGDTRQSLSLKADAVESITLLAFPCRGRSFRCAACHRGMVGGSGGLLLGSFGFLFEKVGRLGVGEECCCRADSDAVFAGIGQSTHTDCMGRGWIIIAHRKQEDTGAPLKEYAVAIPRSSPSC